MNTFYIPSYEDCVKIVQKNECFFEKKLTIDGYNVSIFNYRLAELKDFLGPVPNDPAQAFELRGITFIHTDNGPIRFLMLHKFFNLNQVEGYQFHQVKDHSISRIQDKADGSMIRFIRFPNGKILAKTKGDFANTQAKMAQDLFDQDINLKKFVTETIDQGLAAIFELISPFNQIVLSYSQTSLILLQLRDESSGEYYNIYNHEIVLKHKIKTVEIETSNLTLEKYVESALTKEDVEGWIVTLSTGQILKVKTKWYCDRHGLLTFDLVHEDRIISLIVNEQMDDVLSMINDNDPRRKYAHEIRETLLKYFKEKEEVVISLVEDFKGDRKSWAMKNLAHPYFPIAATLVGKQNYKDQIYTHLKNHVLKITYRLMEAKTFLAENGLKTQTIELDQDDS